MRYEFLVDDGTRFEDEREDPLREGELFTQLDVTYRVLQILPGHDDLDRVVKVAHVGGPVEHLPP